MDEAFWMRLKNKPGFDWFVEAKRYLHAAEVLRTSAEYQQGAIITPPLHLLAHGTELLLKANLIAGGTTLIEARLFGHGIWKLWNDDRNTSLRSDILQAADEEWQAAKMNPVWQDTFSEDSAALFEEYLKRLSDLHNKDTDFALRYIRPEGTEAPKPHMLGPTMYRVADRYVRDMAQTNHIDL